MFSCCVLKEWRPKDLNVITFIKVEMKLAYLLNLNKVYHNVYQRGYAIGSFDESKQVLSLGEFDELDRGFDFYAPQTFKNHDGRIIMYGWAGVPDAVEHVNPTIEKGWQHCLTLPRELVLK